MLKRINKAGLTIKEYNLKYYKENKEKIRLHAKKYYNENKEKCAESNRLYRLNNKEKIRKSHRVWFENNREYFRKENRKRLNKLREKCFIKYGNKCIKCRFNNPLAFHFDHVNGDGHLDRKRRSTNPWAKWKNILDNKTGKYQLLCANCHQIKTHLNREYSQRGPQDF